MTSPYARDRQTVRDACGVRLPPAHILSRSVHAHRTWMSETVVETWCGIPVDLSAGGVQTTELIGCLACGQASWDAFRRL